MNPKTIISLPAFLLAALLLLAVPAAVQAQFTYSTNGGSVSINGYNGSGEDGGAVAIPATINGLPVTSIGAVAFDSASISSVSIPGSVTSIGDYAFYGCTSLTNVDIPTGLTNIGQSAFSSCRRLPSVIIPASVSSIGQAAFAECTGLTAITVAAQNSFYGSLNGVLFNKTLTVLFQYPCGLAGSYTVPGLVTNIAASAFQYCASLTSVTFSNSVNSIGQDAFAECTSLTNVDIPSGLTNIGSGAFVDCTGLTAITVAPQNSFYGSLNGVLFNKGLTALFQYPCGLAGSYTVPGLVTNIAASAFQGCIGLTNLTIPGSLSSIGLQAFTGCSSLVSLSLGIGVTSIGPESFEDCSALTNISLPGSLTNIGQVAFSECSKLTSLTIPGNVISIGDYAFESCSDLTNALFTGNAPTADSTVFSSDGKATVYYFAGTTGWGTTFGGRPTVALWPGTYTTSNGAITITGYFGPGGTVTIPSFIGGFPVSSIGNAAFYSYTNLTNVTIPGSVTNIGADAFFYCTNLSTVTIPNSVTTIGSGAFADCTGLTSLTFGNSVTSIGQESFEDCTALTNITIPNSVISIESGAFAYCTSLNFLIIPGSVTTIGSFAFNYCTSLSSVFFTGNAPTVGYEVFASDLDLTIYDLPGTTGWSSPFAGVPSILWNPLIQAIGVGFGVQSNQFGFNITGSTDFTVFVEACTNLACPVWIPLQTLSLTNGSAYFSDPDWTNYPSRFYCLGFP
jgi:hypothetical protein